MRPRPRPAASLALALLVLALPLPQLLVVLCSLSSIPGSHAWPQQWLPFAQPRPDISTAAQCRAATKNPGYKGDSIYAPLQAFFNVTDSKLQLAPNSTDITTAATIIQRAVPDLKLVLDPLLYLKSLPKPQRFPKLIHMTLPSKRSLLPHQILSIISWGRFNRGYALLLYDNKDITGYIKTYYPGFLPTYHQLKTYVEKSDAWRYYVLCGHGGLYADTDTICAKPFDSWTRGALNTTTTAPEPHLIVGIENLFHSQAEAEEASYVHKVQVTQWTMASWPGHPVVCRMGSAIKGFVDHEAATGNAVEALHGHDASILQRTGPGIWSVQVHSYLRLMGSSPEAVAQGGRVADVLVLPQVRFGCNVRYWDPDATAVHAYHWFANSWKTDHFVVADAKKASRKAQERQAALQRWRRRLQYAWLGVAAVCGGLLLLVYAGWLQPPSSGRWQRYYHHAQRRRPQALVVGSSALGSSPKSSPKRGSPAGSRGASSSSASMHGGRAAQRQSALHLLSSGGTRKPARLVH